MFSKRLDNLSKAVTILSISILFFFIIGTTFQINHILIWLAAEDFFIQIIRIVLIILLSTILLTTPPRNLAFRIVSGFVAVCTAGVAISGMYSYHVQVGDCISMVLSSIVIGIAALEAKFDDKLQYNSSVKSAEI